MRHLFMVLIATILLTACTSTAYQPPATSYQQPAANLYATADNAAIQETAVAATATTQSAQATQAVQIATQGTATAVSAQSTRSAEKIVQQATVQALQSQATMQAIAANATATAVSHVAEAEAQLMADEQTRLSLQRAQEYQAVQRAKIINALLPALIIIVAMTAVAFLLFLAWRYWQLSRPVIATNGELLALPAGHYQQPRRALSVRTQTPEEEEETAVTTTMQLPRLESGHVLIVGVTGDGKTMALREIVEHRSGDVVVLDPHYTPGAWGLVRVIGGGRDFDAIRDYMRWMDDELTRRSQQRAGGQTHFPPLTVATEEMPAIMDSGGTAVAAIWRRWMREGRKFGLFMAVVTQSTRVRSLGIEGEGDLLENFRHVLLLGKAAVNDYPDLVGGMEHPAVWRSGYAQPQPVVIPYDPRRDPESPQFQPLLPEPMAGREAGLATEGGFVTAQEMREILRLDAAGHSRRAISREMYNGQDGGAAYSRVKGVLDAAGRPISTATEAQ